MHRSPWNVHVGKGTRMDSLSQMERGGRGGRGNSHELAGEGGLFTGKAEIKGWSATA